MSNTKKYYYKNKEKRLEQMKIYREKNREEIREKGRKRYIDNPEKMRERSRQWRKDHLEEIRKYDRKRYIDNTEKMREIGRKSYRNNIEKKKERDRKYRMNNRDIRRKNEKNRYENDLKFNINTKMRRGINQSLKKTKCIRNRKNGRPWETIVEYTINDLIKRLRKTIPEGYTWKDFLYGKLHIDHIIPIAVFNFNRPEHMDFKKCWALKNLRLLPAKENIIKRNKLGSPFQPGLKLLEK